MDDKMSRGQYVGPTKKPKPMNQGSTDDYQTPKEALYPLLPYLRKEWVIWEPAAGKGNLKQGLDELGHKVVATDILNNGHDFLKWTPAEFDCIITNPPFSLKQEFLVRVYQLGRPFALLLPLTTFESERRQHLFAKHGVQVIFFDKRINFETPSGGGGREHGSLPHGSPGASGYLKTSYSSSSSTLNNQISEITFK